METKIKKNKAAVRQWLFFIMVMAVVSPWVCRGGPKAKAKDPVDQEIKNEGFQQLFATVFSEWDVNQDGLLDLPELNAAIDNPLLKGNAAAIAAALRRRVPPEEANEPRRLTREQVMAMATNPSVQQAITRNAWHIHSINHSLFLPGDPNLETFHQGGMGDCYLLAVIGAFVYQTPLAVRSMIQQQADGQLAVQFGNGQKVVVPPLSDAELIMGASEGRDHGIWLSVLEKAFARHQQTAKETRTGVTNDADAAVFSDFIGHGGYYGPVIKLLTGHKALNAPPIGRWMKEDPQTGLDKLDAFLTAQTVKHRLMATGTRNKIKLPKGIAHGHAFAVLDYSPSTRMVRMFNPWGDHVKPSGPPGLVNGYFTEHGIFAVPLADFPEIFAGLEYESDR